MTSKLLLLSFLTFALTPAVESCGKKKDKEDAPSNEPLTGPAAFVGEWNGIYNPLNGDGKPNGDSRPVIATFYDDSRFKIMLTEDRTAYAEGTWSEFSGKSLFLTVKKSTISAISSTKAVIDMSYSLAGSSADIHNGDFSLKISRIKTSNSPSTGLDSTKSGPAGQWTCSGSGKTTVLNISGSEEGFKWRGTVTQDGHSMLMISGTGHIAPESNYILAIESSQPETIKGSSLSFTLQGTGAVLSAVAPSGKRDSLGECHRD